MLQKALAGNNNLTTAHLTIADAYLKKGRYEDAIAEAREAGNHHGFDAAALALEARIRSVPKTPTYNLRLVQELTQKAINMNSKDTEALISASMLALNENRLADAKNKISAAIAEEPGNLNAYVVLSEIAKAENAAEPAVLLSGGGSQSPEQTYNLARALERIGDASGSIKCYQLSLSAGLSGAEQTAANEAISRLTEGAALPKSQ